MTNEAPEAHFNCVVTKQYDEADEHVFYRPYDIGKAVEHTHAVNELSVYIYSQYSR